LRPALQRSHRPDHPTRQVWLGPVRRASLAPSLISLADETSRTVSSWLSWICHTVATDRQFGVGRLLVDVADRRCRRHSRGRVGGGLPPPTANLSDAVDLDHRCTGPVLLHVRRCAIHLDRATFVSIHGANAMPRMAASVPRCRSTARTARPMKGGLSYYRLAETVPMGGPPDGLGRSREHAPPRSRGEQPVSPGRRAPLRPANRPLPCSTENIVSCHV
jgi:hypothetical protein